MQDYKQEKQNAGKVILQIPSSLCPMLHYRYKMTNTDKKTTTGLPSGKQYEKKYTINHNTSTTV